jgi:hypothetical protein
MKKRIMILAASLFAVAAVATTVAATNSNDEASLLARNVEALASGESGWFYCSGYPVPLVCVWDSNGNPYDAGEVIWL